MIHTYAHMPKRFIPFRRKIPRGKTKKPTMKYTTNIQLKILILTDDDEKSQGQIGYRYNQA